ncbi:MAG: hypothetical protein MUP53_07995, partial [Bacteroidales bacterium]|nr:hypothetical protein [Bacteroidales bacterium]
DISNWNCQDPNVPAPLNPMDYDNDSPRRIQFVYGEDPTGAIMNTISGNVTIGGTFTANGSGGYVGPVIGPVNPPNPNTLSEVITIPSTSVAGQRFYVYLKDWNKCNPFVDENLNYVYEDFIIEIVSSPPAPGVVTPKDYCEGNVPSTITATPTVAGYTLNWYGDAALTDHLYTGLNYTHGKTAPGTYNFWVTQSGGVYGCEGPAAQITMNIYGTPSKPTITASGPVTFCFNGVTSVTLTANPNTPPAVSSYQWYRNGGTIGGATSSAITLNQVNQSGDYTVRTYGVAPTFCPGPLSDPVTVTIGTPPVATAGAQRNLCNTSTTNLQGNTGGNDLATGAYGEWTFINNLIWQETFSESPDYATSGSQWSTSGITPDADTYFRTESRRMVGRDLDAEAVWTSELINISPFSTVDLSVALQETGNLNNQDYIRVYYSINGGGETLFTNGNRTGNFGSGTATASALDGNTLRIIIRVRNNSNSEYHYFDNITVRETSATNIPVIASSTSPTSSVSGLWAGYNYFRWSVFSDDNVCDSVSVIHTILRDLAPAAAYAGPPQSFCENSTTIMAANAATNGGTGTWTRVSGAGTVTEINNPLSAVTGLGYGPNV